ncbi:MAG: cycloartenol synthase [Verrucomicrobiae bacterium]|nr:cycloartenol synthase [Verrucomicrobiae bacterium]
MNRISLHLILASAVFLGLAAPVSAQEKRVATPGADRNLSLKLEIERAIAKGVTWLEQHQDAEKGTWSDPVNPSLTALPVMAIIGDPNREAGSDLPASAKKGFDYIVSTQQPDGGLYTQALATYNTALSVTALSVSGQKEYLPVIAKARRYLVGLQQDDENRGQNDTLYDGGIGYSGSRTHSDMSNTHFALEALYYSKKALADTEYDNSNEVDLDWDAAIEFVSLCQNSDDTIKKLGDGFGMRDEDRGGFVYHPGNTKADEFKLDGGKVALRSYGSMTYAGLLSFVYAEMSEDDPRVVAAREWLKANYSVKENPGMEAQGLFYYYHTMSKALATSRTGKLELEGGKLVDWHQDLAVALFDRQQSDGSWVNEESKRWMEDDPALVTAYALLALEHVYRTL